MAFKNISVILSASTGDLSRGLEKGAKEVEAFGIRARGVATSLTALGTVLGIAAVASVRMASDFQKAMELVHTQAGASQAEVDAMKNSVLALAPAVGAGPVKLADALYHVESVGLRGARALDVLKTAAMGAAIGHADLEATANALTATIASNIGGFHGMKDAMAVLNNTVGQGNMRMDDLAASMSTGVLPAAKTAGLGLIDVGAALATMTDTGVPAEEAATRLRMTFSLMASPVGSAAKALAGIGISSTQLATDMRQPNGLLVAVQDLRNHLGNLNTTAGGIAAEDTLVKAFGGGRSSGAIMTLVQEVDRLQTKYESYGTVASRQATFQEAWAKTTETFAFKLHQLGAEAQVVGIRVGTVLLPVLTHAIGGFQTVAHWAAASARFLHDHQAAVAAVGAAWVAIKWGSIVSLAQGAMASVRVAIFYVRMEALNATASVGGLSAAMGRLGVVAAAAAGIYMLVKGLQEIRNAGKGTAESIKQVNDALGEHPDLTALAAARKQIEDLRGQLKDPTVQNFWERLGRGFERHHIAKVEDYRKSVAELDAELAKLQVPFDNLTHNVAALGARYQLSAGQVRRFADAHKIDLTQGVDAATAAFDRAVAAQTGVSGATGAMIAAYGRMETALVAWHTTLDPATKSLQQQFDLLDKLPGKLKLTGAELLKQVQAQTKAMLDEGVNVRKLVREGLDPAVIKALVDKGPEYIAAAAQLSMTETRRFGRDYATAQRALHSTANTIAKAEAPKPYQAVIDAAEAKRKAIADAQYKTFVAQLIPALATARQIAAQGMTTTMDGAGHKVNESAPQMLSAYLHTLKDPLRSAVAVAMGVGRQGGLDMVAAVATAIVSATPRAGASARVMTRAIQEEINALRGTKVAITVDELIAKASFRAQWQARQTLFPFFSTGAEGGPIVGGQRGRDSVPLLAMPDEHILTVDDVQAMGGHQSVLAFRRALHMAAGGPVVADVIQHPPGGMVAPPARAEAARLATQAAHVFERMFASAASAAAAVGGGGGPPSANETLMRSLAASMYGWVGGQWAALRSLIMRESGFVNTAQNPTSTAYGQFQFLDSTWAGYGGRKTSDPRTQDILGFRYIASRYGTPAGAWAHEVSAGWYDRGGYLPPGLSLALNTTGRPEPVGGGGVTVHAPVTISVSGADSPELTAALVERKISAAFTDLSRMIVAGTGRG